MAAVSFTDVYLIWIVTHRRTRAKLCRVVHSGIGMLIPITPCGPVNTTQPHSIIAFEHAGGNISVSPVVSPDGSTVYFESEDNNIYAIQTNASGADPTILWNSNNVEYPACTLLPDALQPLTISQDGLWLFRSCQIKIPSEDPYNPTYSYQIEAIHTATGKHAWDKHIMNMSYSQDMTPYVLIGGDGIPYTFITLTYNLPVPPPPPPPPPPSY